MTEQDIEIMRAALNHYGEGAQVIGSKVKRKNMVEEQPKRIYVIKTESCFRCKFFTEIPKAKCVKNYQLPPSFHTENECTHWA